MGADPAGVSEERILILAPIGRDSEVLRLVLGRAGLAVQVCDSIDAVVAELQAPTGTGTLVLSEEALSAGAERLALWVARQPPWCDLPIIVLRSDLAQFDDITSAAQAFAQLGNVSLLERPLRAETLISAVRSALRARRRQYQVRAHLLEREQTRGAPARAQCDARRAGRARRRRAASGRGGARPGAENRGARAPDRRGGARFQQSADRDRRQSRTAPVAASGNRRERAPAGRRGDPQHAARGTSDAAAARFRPQADAAIAAGGREPRHRAVWTRCSTAPSVRPR